MNLPAVSAMRDEFEKIAEQKWGPQERAAVNGVKKPPAAPQLTGLARMKAMAGQPIEQFNLGGRKLLTKLSKAKLASLVHPAVDLAGLGILAVPSVKELRDKKTKPHDRSKAKWELAGLGTLAGVSGHELASGLKKHWKKAV